MFAHALASDLAASPANERGPDIWHAGARAHAAYHHRALVATSFCLEGGGVLPELHMAWCAYGPPDAPIVWVSHALTANADVQAWWPGLFGPGKVLDPTRYRIICPNILGSCYGSTGPASTNLATGQAYADGFPLITVRDQARAQAALAAHLGIGAISLLIGGSLGGMQALELVLGSQLNVEQLVVLACPARQSAWAQGFNETQRLALGSPATEAGLVAARAIAMLSYRTYEQYGSTQTDPDETRLENYAVARYQKYQGQKLVARFYGQSYRTLSLAMDTHHVGRGQESVAAALKQIAAATLVIGLSSDGLFPVKEQRLLAQNIPKAQLVVIDSPYGHDGFLTEGTAITNAIQAWQTCLEA